MAFPVNSGGQIHPQYGNQPTRPQAPVQQQTPNPTDGFVPHQQGMAPQQQMAPQQPAGHVFPNGLKIEAFSQGGQQTALYATMPGGPGGLLGTSILVSVSTLPAQNTLGASFQQAEAYELDSNGKVQRDENKMPKTLPAQVMSDGRIYVQTDKDNPNAPLVMLDPDGSYGLATPARPKMQGDPQLNMGYTREQAEFVKPDNSRGWRVNEDVGAFGQQQHQEQGGLGSMMGMMGGMMGMGAGAGREVTYTEVNHTQKGLDSRDVHFSQEPGAAWPGFSQGNQWSKMLTMNKPDTRERTVVQEGMGMKLEGGWSGKRVMGLLTGTSGWGANTWSYGKQETVRFVPLSTQRMMQEQGGPPPLPNTPPVQQQQPNMPPPLPPGF